MLPPLRPSVDTFVCLPSLCNVKSLAFDGSFYYLVCTLAFAKIGSGINSTQPSLTYRLVEEQHDAAFYIIGSNFEALFCRDSESLFSMDANSLKVYYLYLSLLYFEIEKRVQFPKILTPDSVLLSDGEYFILLQADSPVGDVPISSITITIFEVRSTDGRDFSFAIKNVAPKSSSDITVLIYSQSVWVSSSFLFLECASAPYTVVVNIWSGEVCHIFAKLV